MAAASGLHLDGSNGSTTFTDEVSGVTWTRTGSSFALSTTTPKFGTACATSPGGTEYISTANIPVLGTRQFSLQGWFKTSNTATGNMVIVGNYNANLGDWAVLLKGTTGRLEFYESRDGTDVLSTLGVDLRDGAWHYYSITRDASNRLSMSVDGSEVGFATGVTANMNYNEIGLRYGYTTYLAGFDGQLDDLLITLDEALPNTVPTTAFGGAPASYTLSAAAGSFALTGQAASLVAGRRLLPTVGQLLLTGRSAGLVAARNMTATVGVFALTGVAAQMRRTFPLLASPGTFSLTGQDVVFRHARALSAQHGTFTWTRRSAQLIYSNASYALSLARLFTVPPEQRRFTVPAEQRTYTVPAEARAINIEGG